MWENAIAFFEEYTKKYKIKKEDDLKDTFSYKYFHTYRVIEKTKEIISSLNLTEEKTNLAQICALFHDIGRFKQLEMTEAYNDYTSSLDHAKLSLEIISENSIFQQLKLSKEQQEAICFAIINHNKYQITETKKNLDLLLAKILRDADKLAILSEFYKCPMNIQETKLKPSSVTEFLDCQLIHIDDSQKDIDYVLSTLAFIYDLNYVESVKICQKENYIEPYLKILKEKISDKKQIEKIEVCLNAFIKGREKIC